MPDCPLPLWVRASGVLLAVLAGCTTLEDFQKMTPEQRAQQVCRQQIAPLDRQAQDLRTGIADVNAALSAGYRLHRSCRDVERYGDKQVTCTTTNNGPASTTQCTEFRPRRIETVCTDQPVAISFDLERDKLNSFNAQLASTQASRDAAWSSCFQDVLRLSPEAAFSRLK